MYQKMYLYVHSGPPYLRPSETQPKYIYSNCKIYLSKSENVYVDCTPRSPLLATQRNPAHRMMSPGPIGMRPYNLPYNKCSRNMWVHILNSLYPMHIALNWPNHHRSSISGPTRYSIQNRFQSRFHLSFISLFKSILKCSIHTY